MKTNKISNAYDAYWFLYKHPMFCVNERYQSALNDVQVATARTNGRIVTEFVKQDGSIYYQEEANLMRHALEMNLDIFYTKVNEKRIVSKNSKDNKHTECWLEFGPLTWTKSYYDIYHDEPVLENCHDPRLDCGAPTFDEALILLAKKVRRLYGNYSSK